MKKLFFPALVFCLVLAAGASFIIAEFQNPYDDTLVRVTGDILFSGLTPGSGYSRDIIVSWNDPASTISGLNAVIQVDVSAEKGESSYLEFYNEKAAFKSFSFRLFCFIEEGDCVEQKSRLAQFITAKVKLPPGAFSYDDKVLIRARLLTEEEFKIPVPSPVLAPPSPTPVEVPSSAPEFSSTAEQNSGSSGLGGFAVVNPNTLNLGIAVVCLLVLGIILDKFLKVD